VVALLASARATVVEIPATTTGFARWNQDYQGYETYSKFYGNLRLADVYGHWSATSDRPFLKFALDTLPDSGRVISADLNYFQYYQFYSPPITVLKLIPDPVPLGGAAILSAVRLGPELCSHESAQDSWQQRPFNEFALHAIDSCRRVGWVSLGIDCVSHLGPYAIEAYGDSGTFPPYLHVEYTVSGVNDVRGFRMSPLLTITPNPTTGSYVAVRYGSATGAVDKLTLHDALGRTVKSFTLGPSGNTELDLRGFTAGVYMITLDGSVPLVSRRLVITAR